MSDSTARPETAAGPDPWSELRHELRTPLNQIIGYSEMLEEDAAAAGQEEFVPDLKKVQTAAHNLLALINTRLTPAAASLVPALPCDPITQGEASIRPAFLSATPEVASPKSPLSGHVLVVDDNDANRDMLTRRLEQQGLSSEQAADGRAALDMASRTAFDVVLLDVMMEGLDGYATLLALKADPTLRHVPVIMVSALDEIESVVRCIEAGAEDYLPKPFNPTLLRARISASLEKKRLRDAEREHLRVIEETQARLSSELEQATTYVRSIIPEPAERPLPVDWQYRPSTELGGDAFGYHSIDADHFAVYLLDVCGHGVGASLLSVAAINVIRSGSLPGTDFRDPGAVLAALNNAFPMEKQNNMYFTIWYGVYHARTRTLRHASGGHPPALLLVPQADGSTSTVRLCAAGPIIGVMEGIPYQSERCAIPAGSKLLVLCDGCYEILRPDETMMQFEDFEDFVRVHGTEPDGLTKLLGWVQAEHGTSGLDDDFSIVRIGF